MLYEVITQVPLLEVELGPVAVFVNVPFQLPGVAAPLGEGFPQPGAAFALAPNRDGGTGDRTAVGNLIGGVIGEQRVIGIDPSRGEAAVGPYVVPNVGGARYGHEKGAHAVMVRDFIERFPHEIGKFAGRGLAVV